MIRLNPYDFLSIGSADLFLSVTLPLIPSANIPVIEMLFYQLNIIDTYNENLTVEYMLFCSFNPPIRTAGESLDHDIFGMNGSRRACDIHRDLCDHACVYQYSH